jgi:hypothetical protein
MIGINQLRWPATQPRVAQRIVRIPMLLPVAS